MVVVSHLFFFFQINFREGMTRCESHPPCFGTIYFPTAPLLLEKRMDYKKKFKNIYCCKQVIKIQELINIILRKTRTIW